MRLRDKAAITPVLICAISLATHYETTRWIINRADIRRAGVVENILVSDYAKYSHDGSLTGDGGEAGISNNNSEVSYFRGLLGTQYSGTCVSSLIGRFWTSIPGKSEIELLLFIHGGALAEVFHFYADWVEYPRGQGRNQSRLVNEYPGPLASFKGSSVLPDVYQKSQQTCECDDAARYGDVIQALGCSKMRATISLLLGISLIFFGRRLNLYGDRTRNFEHEVAFWIGYSSTLAGGVVVFAVIATLVGQWFLSKYPL